MAAQDTGADALLDEGYHRRVIEDLLTELNEEQRYIVTHSFGLFGVVPRDMETIAEQVGKSVGRIRHIRAAVLMKLRMENDHRRVELI